MQIVPARFPNRMPILLALLAALAAPASDVAAQERPFAPGSVRVPEATDAGSWDGTYWYINREMKVAMWVRTADGVPEVRLRVARLRGGEEFTTDWNAEATYETRHGRGDFALRLPERDANRMAGTWEWNLEAGGSVRKQRGRVSLYRAGIGREVVLLFDPFEFYIGPAGEEAWRPLQQVWTFRKASKRLIRWEELPF